MAKFKCVKCEVLEVVNGYTICREEDRKVDVITSELEGRTYVFYTVNTEDMMLESFKTLAKARNFANDN